MRKPRLQISLSQEMKDTLKELSDLTGTPSSKIASATLESALPVFVDMLDALKVAQENESKAVEMMTASAFKVMGSSMAEMGDLISNIEEQKEGKK